MKNKLEDNSVFRVEYTNEYGDRSVVELNYISTLPDIIEYMPQILRGLGFQITDDEWEGNK